MRTLLILSCLFSTSLGAQLSAAQASAVQAPAAKPPAAQPPATQTPPATRPAVRRRASAAAVTVTFTVTEPGGAPIAGAKVTATIDGAEKDTTSTAGGVARFLSVTPGEYRVRFDHDNYVSLERDIVVKGRPLDMPITLTPAPAPQTQAAPPPVQANTAPPGDARALSIVDFLESNRLNGHDPVRSDQLGCTASAKTTLLQVRDQVPDASQPDSDEVLYVVAGEGMLRLGNKETNLQAGGLAIVPRGVTRGLTRKGKNPLMVMSVASGQPCTK